MRNLTCCAVNDWNKQMNKCCKCCIDKWFLPDWNSISWSYKLRVLFDKIMINDHLAMKMGNDRKSLKKAPVLVLEKILINFL